VFLDYLKLHVKAGDGGDGAIAFLREKYMPLGGPAGGDGGRGGSVILEVDPKLGTLYDLKFHPYIEARRGGGGEGKNKHGRDAEDVILRVPMGTVISNESGIQIADLTEPGQRWVAAQGGKGGLGNQHFATSVDKAPRRAIPGQMGQERVLIIELKLIADVGLVGLPNAGKSTLLSKLTAATPKIAPYPFTTLSPNLGVMEYEDDRRLTLADIPGLIEGASQGVGLGDRFLRHIERTGVLAHLVGDEAEEFDPDTVLYKFDLVCQELSSYSQALANKPQIVVLTKIDLANPEDIEKIVRLFRDRGLDPIAISAEEGTGLDTLRNRLREAVDAALEAVAAEPSEDTAPETHEEESIADED
jgi:GTP-binding protein